MGQAFGLIGSVGGGITSGIGAFRAAETERKAAKFNRKLALRESFREETRLRRAGRIEAEENITRVAKSGVRLEGSPLSVMTENAAIVEGQAQRVRHAGLIQARFFQIQANAARVKQKLALTNSLLGAGSNIGATVQGFGSQGPSAAADTGRQTQTFGGGFKSSSKIGKSGKLS